MKRNVTKRNETENETERKRKRGKTTETERKRDRKKEDKPNQPPRNATVQNETSDQNLNARKATRAIRILHEVIYELAARAIDL